MMIKKQIWLVFFSLIIVSYVKAQAVNTINPGNWNDGSIWSSGTVPNFNSGTITINHAVTIPSGYSVSVDEVTLNSFLVVSSGGTLTLVNGSGVDLTMNATSSLAVNGEFILNNVATITQISGSSFSFGTGSSYRHRYQTTEGVPPVASWNASSNFYVEGFSNSSTIDLTSSAWNQNFGKFIYNCPSQKAAVNFNGLIKNTQSDFSFQSTGSSAARLTYNQTGVAIAVGGNFSILGNSRVAFSVDGTGSSLSIAGNFNYSSTSAIGSFLTNTGSFTINVTNDFVMNAGTGILYLTGSGGSAGIGTINLYKNFTLASGTITEAGTDPSNGNLRFIGNGSFTFVNSGTIINRINYFIASTVTLNLSTYPIAAGANSSFTLDGTIICGSLEPTGAIVSSIYLGNIRTPFNLRTYSSGSKIIYGGLGPQFMGDGQPSASGLTTVIDNSAGVSLYLGVVTTVTLNGVLQLENGMLFIGGGILNLNGTIAYNIGTLGGNGSSILNVGGSSGGSLGTLIFDPSNSTLGTLTLNRTGASGGVDVSSTITVSTQINLVNGDLSNTSGLTIAQGCTVTRYSSSQLLLNRLAHAAGDLYNLTYRTPSGSNVNFSGGLELPLSSDISALNNLTINLTQTGDIVQLPQDITINGSVALTRGTLAANTYTITMKGTTWSDDAGNFAQGTGLVVFNGTTTISGTSTANVGNIQLNTGSSLTCGNNVNISGDIEFQSGSTFDPSTFRISLTGSVLQTISANGADFFNVSVEKSGGNVQLTSNLDLINLLQFNTPSSNCTFQSNGFLTLLSTSDAVGTLTTPGTAQIYRLINGNTVTGDISVQRYMSGEGRIYRYISSPITNATVASWQDDFPITGTFTDPSPSSTICGYTMRSKTASLFFYNEKMPGDINSGYIAYPTSGLASSNPITVGRGYTAYIRECTNPTIVDVTGPINKGTITFSTISYTNTGDPTADGYNLVGNPYPCTIDWDQGWVKTRISPVISVRDNATGVFHYWDGTSGTISNGQIAPGQAFWVRATGANPVLRVTENAKAVSPNRVGEFFRNEMEAGIDYLSISISNKIVTDKTLVKLRPDSKNTFDDWDAPKLNNDAFDLFVLSEDNIEMAIDSRQSIGNASTIQLGIRDFESGDYELSLNETTGSFSNYDYTLVDLYTNKNVPFKDNYNFTIDRNPASFNKDRFIIRLASQNEPAYGGVLFPNPVDRYLYINGTDVSLDRISIYDNVGRLKQVNSFNEDNRIVIDLQEYSSGIYYLNISNQEGIKSYKVIKK
jgi:hypothetical protein